MRERSHFVLRLLQLEKIQQHFEAKNTADRRNVHPQDSTVNISIASCALGSASDRQDAQRQKLAGECVDAACTQSANTRPSRIFVITLGHPMPRHQHYCINDIEWRRLSTTHINII